MAYAIQVTNKRHPIAFSYTIHGHTHDVVYSAKYLGIHLDSHLNLNSHFDTVTQKTNNTRAFLSRNLGHYSWKIKETVFTTFVRPMVEYASTSWDPNSQRNVMKVEQVQRSAARFVMWNFDRYSSVTSTLKELNWPYLQERCEQDLLRPS